MPRRSKLRLTKHPVDALPLGPKDTVFWYRDLAGFGVRVYRTGRKAYLAHAVGPGGAGDSLVDARDPARKRPLPELAELDVLDRVVM